ncbi:phage tail tube protein [Adlercreutzia sp. ZJ141]|uniref:phage tail tube protein n=1 Tax=Adlercreutzia sp. ZJ141 TaxID=2709406 RepID=UPI0013EA39CB|nr:hypothetical protein [Adlercreutzia sp. ZJ141]
MTAIKEIDSSLVTVGKPVEGGCCWTSFDDNPTLPTDATTKMSTVEGFESLGELSENGFTEGKTVDTSEFKGWHGSTVLTEATGEQNTYKMEFIEPNRAAVAKLRYGAGNVESASDGSVTHIKGVAGSITTVPLVIDELESNGYLRRTVVRKASITSFDDVPHQRGSLMVYGMTFTAIEDDGRMFDIYRAKPAAPASV